VLFTGHSAGNTRPATFEMHGIGPDEDGADVLRVDEADTRRRTFPEERNGVGAVHMPEPGVGLAAIGAALRRHRRVLLGAAGLGLLLGLLLTILRPPLYAASSQVLLQGDTQPGRANTEAKVAASAEVQSRASARLPDHPGPAALAKLVTAARLTDDVIEITGRGRSPSRAKQVTDVTTDEYVKYSRDLLLQNANASVAALQPQQDQLDQQSADVEAQMSAASKDPANSPPVNRERRPGRN